MQKCENGKHFEGQICMCCLWLVFGSSECHTIEVETVGRRNVCPVTPSSPPGDHPGGVVPVGQQGPQDRGGDPQGGLARRGGAHSGHRAPRVPPLHLAGRAQAHGALRAPRLRQDYDPLLRPQGAARLRGGRLVIVSLPSYPDM